MRPVARAILAFVLLAMSAGGAGAQSSSGADRDAAVTAVQADRAANAYTFSVTIRSNDTGCDHYADWWEVMSEDGKLLYRRVLLHDHADEQPFTRDGGPVPVDASRMVVVRAHVHPTGYSGKAMRGSVDGGFKSVTLPPGYAAELAKEAPQPPPC